MSSTDLINYDLEKVSDTCFIVNKNGIRTYRIDFKSKRWVCSCPARKECKHLKLLPPEVLVKRFEREKVERLIKLVAPIFQAHKWAVCGSYRRLLPDSKDIDIIVLCTAEEYGQIKVALLALPFFIPGDSGDTITRGKVYDIPIDVDRVTCEEDWAPTLLFRTGPKDLNIKMRSLARDLGYKLNEHGLEGYSKSLYTEEEIFFALGMDYLAPENRK